MRPEDARTLVRKNEELDLDLDAAPLVTLRFDIDAGGLWSKVSRSLQG